MIEERNKRKWTNVKINIGTNIDRGTNDEKKITNSNGQ